MSVPKARVPLWIPLFLAENGPFGGPPWKTSMAAAENVRTLGGHLHSPLETRRFCRAGLPELWDHLGVGTPFSHNTLLLNPARYTHAYWVSLVCPVHTGTRPLQKWPRRA